MPDISAYAAGARAGARCPQGHDEHLRVRPAPIPGRTGHERSPRTRKHGRRGWRGGRLAWPSREADLTSHINTTRPLCTLSGPTKRAESDSKMVTECAKCVPALRDAAAPAMFDLFCRLRARVDGGQLTGKTTPLAGRPPPPPEPRPYVRHVRQPGSPSRLTVLFLANSAVNNTPNGPRPGPAGVAPGRDGAGASCVPGDPNLTDHDSYADQALLSSTTIGQVFRRSCREPLRRPAHLPAVSAYCLSPEDAPGMSGHL